MCNSNLHYSWPAKGRDLSEKIRQRDQRLERLTTEILIDVSLAAYCPIQVFRTVREDLVIDRRNKAMFLIAGAVHKLAADKGADGEREAGGIEDRDLKGSHGGRIVFEFCLIVFIVERACKGLYSRAGNRHLLNAWSITP